MPSRQTIFVGAALIAGAIGALAHAQPSAMPWWRADFDPAAKVDVMNNNMHPQNVDWMNADEVRQAVSPYLFAMGTSSIPAGVGKDSYPGFWRSLAMLRDCASGLVTLENVVGEFGDRAAGESALLAARSEFEAWAKTQPQELTFWSHTVLNAYNQETRGFSLSKWEHLVAGDGSKRRANSPLLFWSNRNQGKISSFQSLTPSIDVGCRDKDGKRKYAYMQNLTLSLATPASVPSQFPMELERARAFVEGNPERAVRIEVTIAPVNGQISAKGPPQVGAEKRVYVKQIVVRGMPGPVIYEQTFVRP